MKGRQGLLATGVLTVLALLALLVLVNAVGASPPTYASPASAVGQPRLQELEVYSSGWLDIAPGETITIEHDYGGDPDLYSVDVWYRDVDGALGIHHKAFGGMEFGEMYWGVAWQRLTASSIELYRFANDVFADQVRVRIWMPDPPPLWDSGWVDINPGDVMTLTHGLGGDTDDYAVSMRFKDACEEGVGVNLHAAGGLEDMGMLYGAAWQTLTPTTIQAVRFRDDVFADQVRLQIYDPNLPAYNSGWRTIEPGQDLMLRHNLGGNRMTYIVRVFARDAQPEGRGPNALYGGGFEANGRVFGSYWQELTDSNITIHREPDDDMPHSADEIRVWIYAPRYIYLPAVTNNYIAPD